MAVETYSHQGTGLLIVIELEIKRPKSYRVDMSALKIT